MEGAEHRTAFQNRDGNLFPASALFWNGKLDAVLNRLVKGRFVVVSLYRDRRQDEGVDRLAHAVAGVIVAEQAEKPVSAHRVIANFDPIREFDSDQAAGLRFLRVFQPSE